MRIVGALFALSTACYAITASPTLRAALSAGEAFIFLFSCCGVAFFWLFVQVLFEDGGRWRLAVAARAARAGERMTVGVAALFTAAVGDIAGRGAGGGRRSGARLMPRRQS
ncbi:MAG: hypothetical protein HXY28_01960 [Hydrogenophilaceae bacterium]|nr:hypothetical protein [Hydrogenophilaceae bacterium]